MNAHGHASEGRAKEAKKPDRLEHLRRQFLEPDNEFSPLPFWFWNGRLERDEIIRQIGDFYDKGVAGFVIHPRLGLTEHTPYLSDSYLELVEAAVAEAERRGMKVILYDEAMYPSGSAMGMVVRENAAYASRGLKMTEYPCVGPTELTVPLSEGELLVCAMAVAKRDGLPYDSTQTVVLDASRLVVAFNPPDDESWSILFFVETFAKGVIRGVYFGQDDMDPDAPPSADLLNPQATETFIRLTHEAYYRALKRYFGSTVIAMFTDEPNMMGRRPTRGLKPWTTGFLDYALQYGFKAEWLPALWLDFGGESAEAGAAYTKALNARLAESFYRPLSEWCERHGIQLTGHPGGSDEIGLLDLFQLPGQDVVWRYVEPGADSALNGPHSTMAKCSSDAARHRGRRRNLNECFGACFKDKLGWYFTADEMKWYMDWLFVRGVNMLVPHAFYYSIEGKRRDERPPDVGPNSIWWPHYSIISGYMKRMSWLMTDSVNAARVAILCEEDRLPWEIAAPLYTNQLEFNYLEERLFVQSCAIESGEAVIGEYRYPVIVVDHPLRFERSTLRKLELFLNRGGMVIVASDAAESAALLPSAAHTTVAGLPEAIHRLLPRDVELSPAAPNIRSSHVVKDGVHFYLFVNEGECSWTGTVKLGVSGYAERWEAWSGETSVQPVKRIDTARQRTLPSGAAEGTMRMQMPLALERRASVIVCVDPGREPLLAKQAGAADAAKIERTIRLVSGWTASIVKSVEGTKPQTSHMQAGQSIELGSWTAWEGEGMRHFSGEVVYTHEFELDPSDISGNFHVQLDLGDVEETAEVELNGVKLGVRFWKPYRFADISAAAKPGVNRLSITVANSLANAYNRASLPSGLLGPVTVTIAER
ncbi:MAG: hypothetical protein K0Q59_2704 [Paenibacillus sp.]|nr:hypothetical protein [Paenibacillus sp.]